jgi:hypothetical protein
VIQRARAAHLLATRGEAIAGPGQRVLITAGVPFSAPGPATVLRITRIARWRDEMQAFEARSCPKAAGCRAGA